VVDRTLSVGISWICLVALVVLGGPASAASPGVVTVNGPATNRLIVPASAAQTIAPASGPDSSILVVDAVPQSEAFVRIDLRSVTGVITSARLRLHVSTVANAGSPVGGTVLTSDDAEWTGTTQWTARPVANGRLVSDLPAAVADTWVDIDVTRVVRTGEQVTFVLRSQSPDAARYDAVASGSAFAPRIELVVMPAMAERVVTVPAAADVTLDSARPTTVTGAEPRLVVSSSPVRAAVLRFDLSGVTSWSAPELRVHPSEPLAPGASVPLAITWISDGAWSEASTTWDSPPLLDATPVVRVGVVDSDGWVRFDLSGMVAPSALLSLELRAAGAGTGVALDSREQGLGPELRWRIGAVAAVDTPVRVWAVGDIACPGGEAVTSVACHMRSTSNLVVADPELAAFFALGDLQYPGGGLADFATGYGPSFGRVLARTLASPGNHEYVTAAAGYFAYFGTAAHPQSDGYYSADLGTTWHVVVLNSNCSAVSCSVGSPQELWLRADLAASTRPCTIAFWHHPRFSSGARVRLEDAVLPFWNDLAADGAELVLNGHEHQYERFAPQTPLGSPDPNGVREIIAGSGGRSLYVFGPLLPTTEFRVATFGALRLDLDELGYSWSFVDETGTVLDAGHGACH
jgi:hypothetical protein